MKESKTIYVILMIALCGSIAAGVGLTTNISGLFLTPISNELNVGRGAVSLAASLCNIVFAAGGIAAGKWMNPRRFKLLIIAGVCMTVVSTFLLSRTSSLIVMYILQGMRGFTTGLTGTVLASLIISNWFHENTAFFTSIAMGFSGLAGALFSPLFSAVIRQYGWRTAYVGSALLMVVLYLPIILAPIGLSPEDVNAKPLGTKTQTKVTAEAPTKVPGSLFVVLAVYASMGGLLTGVVQHFPGVAEYYDLASVGAIMLSICMVMNTAGKLILGTMIDHIGVKKSILIFVGIIMAGVVLLLTVHQSFALMIGAACVGLGYSVGTVGVAMTVRNSVGINNYAAVYPKIAVFTTVCYAMWVAIIGYIYDLVHSYTPVFVCMIVFLVVITFCINHAISKEGN